MEFKKIVYPAWPAPGRLQGRTTGTMHWGEKPVCAHLSSRTAVSRRVGGLTALSPGPLSNKHLPKKRGTCPHTITVLSVPFHNQSFPLLPCSHECMLSSHGGGPTQGIGNSWLTGSRKNKIQRTPKLLGTLPNQMHCQWLVSSNAIGPSLFSLPTYFMGYWAVK